jgi:TRAP-type uncharacterized transport system fused permease subunit
MVGNPPLMARLATLLNLISLMLGLVWVFRDAGKAIPVPEFAATVLYALVGWAVYSSVRKRLNWMRWVLIVVGMLCLVDLLVPDDGSLDPMLRDIRDAQDIMVGAAAFLLLLPASRRWFTRARDA